MSDGTPIPPPEQEGLPADTLERTLPPFVDPRRPANRDRLGRKLPARLDVGMLMQGAALLVGNEFVAERLRVVPDRAIAETGADEEGVYALVECPCGRQPIARPVPVKCSGCERHYVTSGANPGVYVIYGEMEPPSAR